MPTIIPIPAFADNYIWLLREGNAAAVVDAGDAVPVIDYLERERLDLTGIICTHHHGDHVGGNRALLQRWQVPVYGPARETIPGRTTALGEGDEMIFVDDPAKPIINGTGTEDYFGGAWNFDVPGEGYSAYSTPFLGLHQVIRPDGLYDSQLRFGMYRWHVPDPIRFATDLRVTVQALGWRAGGRYLPLHDDLASTALFYLDRPTSPRPDLPALDGLEPL